MLQKKRSNRMGTEPIGRLVLSISTPIMLSMLVQSLYNAVDSMFVAQLGEEALTALSFALPIQTLMIAIAVGTAVGMNAELSKNLGAENQLKANEAAKQGIFLTAIHYSLFLIIGLTLIRPYFEMQTSNQQIIDYGMEYTVIVVALSVGKFFQIMLERILQSTGRTIHTMFTQGLGAILNIILDPILIFGWFGFPAMGVLGAAVATVIAQICSAILALIINIKMNDDVEFNFRGFRPNLDMIKRIYSVGIPSGLMIAIVSLVTFLFNQILSQFTETAIAVYGAYTRLQGFAFMPIFGLDNGMIPILSYNYGAKNKDRVIKTIKVCLCLGIGILIVGTIGFQIFSEQLLLLFNASDAMLEIGVPALRIISISFTFAGFSIMCASISQAFGNGKLSLWIQLVRQLMVLLPAAYLLSLTGDLSNVWWSKLISELAAILVAVWTLRRIYLRKIKPMPDESSIKKQQ